MDMMWLFFHAHCFSEMIIEREVKCYNICTTVVSGFIHVIVLGFDPVPMYFSVCCPAVKTFKDYQQTWLMHFDICVVQISNS